MSGTQTAVNSEPQDGIGSTDIGQEDVSAENSQPPHDEDPRSLGEGENYEEKLSVDHQETAEQVEEASELNPNTNQVNATDSLQL